MLFSSKEHRFAKRLSAAASKAGHDCLLERKAVSFFDGKLRVQLDTDAYFDAGSDSGRFCQLTLKLLVPGYFEQPLLERVNAFAASDAEALNQAIQQWLGEDFHAFRTLISGLEGPAVRANMRVADSGKLARKGAWEAILGPLWMANMEGAQSCCQHCLFTALLPEIDKIQAVRQPFAVKIFASNQQGKAQADCRLNGGEFPDGAAAAAQAAAAWKVSDGLEMRRQFMLLVPVEN